jgi:SAM-dependent methyltransferase
VVAPSEFLTPAGTEAERTRRSYDRVATRYAREIADELRYKPLDRGLLDAFAASVSGGVVADVGCGPGHVADYLSARGIRVVGLDLSPAMCAAARDVTSVPMYAADMTALPLRTASLSGLLSMYAVIHLSRTGRIAAYREFARVLRTGGDLLLAFHTSDAQAAMGEDMSISDWWGQPVALTFRFLDPSEEIAALREAGFALEARMDREPYPDVEHPSRRSYLLARRR